MTTFDPAAYGPAIEKLLVPPRLPSLAVGPPDPNRRPLLEAWGKDTAFAPRTVRDPDMAAACRAALWLYHDFLDEAHTISQDLATAEGSYWHALVHRREPDYANSKYWFRRVGTHPVYAELCEQASWLAAGEPPQWPLVSVVTQGKWDPFAFVDLCQASADEQAAGHELCRQVQRVEWELLFAYCYERAFGRG